jgi:hypothetical protein
MMGQQVAFTVSILPSCLGARTLGKPHGLGPSEWLFEKTAALTVYQDSIESPDAKAGCSIEAS